MTIVQIYSDKLNHEFGLPKYETDGAAGMDIRANETVTLKPNETKLIKTGLFVAIPKMYEIQVRPRSGMSLKTPFRVAQELRDRSVQHRPAPDDGFTRRY